MEAFLVKLKNTLQHLTPSGSHPMDNYSLMLAMFEVVKQQGGPSQPTTSHQHDPATFHRSFLKDGSESYKNVKCLSC